MAPAGRLGFSTKQLFLDDTKACLGSPLLLFVAGTPTVFGWFERDTNREESTHVFPKRVGLNREGAAEAYSDKVAFVSYFV